MDEQNTVDIQVLQDRYLEATLSQNQEDIDKAKADIESVLSGGKPAPQPEPEPETKEDTTLESLEIKDDSVAKEGEPSNEEEPSLSENWIDSLDPIVQKEVKKILEEKQQLSHRMKSDDGRVAAYQRRYDELQRKAVQQEEMLKSLQAKTAQPQGNPAASKQASINDDPDLKAIAETDEQLAAVMWKREQALRKEIEESQNRFSELENRVTGIVKFQEDVKTQQELDRLNSIVPGATDIFTWVDPDTGRTPWLDWVQSAPPALKALADSSNADDVAYALQFHIADMRRHYGIDKEQDGGSAQETVETPVDKSKIDAVQAERARKLQAQPVGAASRPPQKTKPTPAEILANPELLAAEQERIYQEELKKMGR